jgi:uncharacterized membrane protein YgcG
MTIYATIGAEGLYLLFAWLISAAAASWLTERKGYGERVGLTFGLLLSVIGLLIVLLLPGRPGSSWKVEGPLPRRSRSSGSAEGSSGPASGGSGSAGGGSSPG